MFNSSKKNKKESNYPSLTLNASDKADKIFYALSPYIDPDKFPCDVFYNPQRREYYTTDIKKSRCYMDEEEKCAIFEKVRVEDVWPCAQITDASCMIQIEKERSINLGNEMIANIHLARNELLNILQNSRSTKANMTDAITNAVKSLDKVVYHDYITQYWENLIHNIF